MEASIDDLKDAFRRARLFEVLGNWFPYTLSCWGGIWGSRKALDMRHEALKQQPGEFGEFGVLVSSSLIFLAGEVTNHSTSYYYHSEVD